MVNKTMSWMGYTWKILNNVDDSWGPNFPSPGSEGQNVWVDAQGLHLATTHVGGQWHSAQINTLATFGPGTYVTQMVNNPLTTMGPTDTRTVLAPGFYFKDDTDELDMVEYSRWGDAVNRTRTIGQSTVHTTPLPNTAYHSPFYEINASNTTITMVWNPNGNITWTITDSSGNILWGPYNYVQSDHSQSNPTARDGYFMLECWINGSAPTDGVAKEMVLSGFSYTKAGACPGPMTARIGI